MRTSRFYPTGQPRVDSTYRSHFPCHQSNPRIKIPYGTSSGYRNNNPHPHNMKQVFNHPSKVREKKCAIVKISILGLILRLAQRAIQLFWVTCKNCKHFDCEVLGPKYFGLILMVNYFKTKRPTSYTFSISFFNYLSNWTQSWLLLLLFFTFPRRSILCGPIASNCLHWAKRCVWTKGPPARNSWRKCARTKQGLFTKKIMFLRSKVSFDA